MSWAPNNVVIRIVRRPCIKEAVHPIEIQTKRERLQKQDFKTLRGLLVCLSNYLIRLLHYSTGVYFSHKFKDY